MKTSLLLALTILIVASSQNVFAGNCVDAQNNDIFDQPDVFQELISKKTSCYEASQLAESCAYGSGLDVYTAGLAYEVCATELKKSKPNAKAAALLGTMNKMCAGQYSKMQGSMYRSAQAFCSLEAISWILNVSRPQSEL